MALDVVHVEPRCNLYVITWCSTRDTKWRHRGPVICIGTQRGSFTQAWKSYESCRNMVSECRVISNHWEQWLHSKWFLLLAVVHIYCPCIFHVLGPGTQARATKQLLCWTGPGHLFAATLMPGRDNVEKLLYACDPNNTHVFGIYKFCSCSVIICVLACLAQSSEPFQLLEVGLCARLLHAASLVNTAQQARMAGGSEDDGYTWIANELPQWVLRHTFVLPHTFSIHSRLFMWTYFAWMLLCVVSVVMCLHVLVHSVSLYVLWMCIRVCCFLSCHSANL